MKSMRIIFRRLCFRTNSITTCIFTAMTLLFFLHHDTLSSRAFDGITEKKWLKNRQELLASDVPRKLLLLSYMRGGSKIAGQVFNRDPNAIMWHEPMAPYYMAEYGLSFANLPQHTLFGKYLDKILFSAEERSSMANYLSNIYTCRYDALPPHTWMHKFLFFTEAETIKSLRFCLKPKRQHGMVDQCKHLGQTCGYIDESRRKYCPYIMKTSRQLLNNMTKKALMLSEQLIVNKVVKQLEMLMNVDSGLDLTTTQYSTVLNEVIKHELCIEKMRRENIHCLQRSIKECNEATLHVTKVNRMRMEDIERILAVHSELSIIHYVRDPRAIAASRVERRLCIDRDNPDVVKEAKLVCERMREDIQHRKALASKYPKSIITIKYEDLILNPNEQAQVIYKFLGMEFPAKSDWFEYAKTAIYGDTDHLSTRRNGTESIDKWKRTIHNDDIILINACCSDVINELGYTNLFD